MIRLYVTNSRMERITTCEAPFTGPWCHKIKQILIQNIQYHIYPTLPCLVGFLCRPCSNRSFAQLPVASGVVTAEFFQQCS